MAVSRIFVAVLLVCVYSALFIDNTNGEWRRKLCRYNHVTNTCNDVTPRGWGQIFGKSFGLCAAFGGKCTVSIGRKQARCLCAPPNFMF